MHGLIRDSWVRAATILESESTSGAVVIEQAAIGNILMPDAFTGTALTFEISHDGLTYWPVYDLFDNAVSLSVTAERAYPLPTEVLSAHWLRLVSNASEGAERTIYISLKG